MARGTRGSSELPERSEAKRNDPWRNWENGWIEPGTIHGKRGLNQIFKIVVILGNILYNGN